jgi:hypothetical protein
VQTRTTSLSNLQAATKYFIIVRATDDKGDTAYRSGSFRTITPVGGPTQLAGGDPEPGCAAGCITKAVATPGESLDPAKVEVRTHTPAQIQLMLSTDAPTYVDGSPTVAKKDVWHTSGIDYIHAWDFTVTGLQPATRYHGIVVAIDANGHRHHAVGELTTDGVDLLVTMHSVHITKDGDDGKHNRGEIQLAWGVGEDTRAVRGEDKIHAGSTVSFGRNESSYVLRGAKGTIPTVYLSAAERDNDLIGEFCSAGTGVFREPAYIKGCDRKWNVAASPTLRVADLGHLQTCAELGVHDGFEDDPCVRIVSEDLSGDYAHFWAVVSFKVQE